MEDEGYDEIGLIKLNILKQFNDMDKYNAYILSNEFQEEYRDLWKKHYPNMDLADIFSDLLMFDPSGEPILYPDYIKLYAHTSKSS
jgi:hypothetical protein